jgi:hypothetical protein
MQSMLSFKQSVQNICSLQGFLDNFFGNIWPLSFLNMGSQLPQAGIDIDGSLLVYLKAVPRQDPGPAQDENHPWLSLGRFQVLLVSLIPKKRIQQAALLKIKPRN